MNLINKKAPEFTEDAFVKDDIKKINLSDYKGKWVVLFFYPADFTFVCPTELGELAENYDKIKAANEKRSVLGKVATADDVADAILSFINGSAAVTGQVMVVDGGRSISP